MKLIESAENLLHRFVLTRSEEAFRRIVQQQSGLVLATAARQLRGDRAGAEDVAQEVFAELAKKADGLDGKVTVAGWLYRQTCRRCSNYLRAEGRRRARESKAVEFMKSEPDGLEEEVIAQLDEALNELPEGSRDAVVLRYFDGRNHRVVAGHFGISEEAARKRVARAVELLRAALERRGLRVALPALAAGLARMAPGRVEAAMISQLTAHAMKMPVAKAGLFSAGAMLVGALAVSVVAGGLGVASSGRSGTKITGGKPSSSTRAITEERRPGYLRGVSVKPDEEPFLSEILALVRGPQHELSELKLRVLLDQISNAEIAGFIEKSKGRLSRVGREICYLHLVKRWAKEDPDMAVTFALENDLQGLTGSNDGSGVIPSLLREWCGRDAVAACDWLQRNWMEPKLEDQSMGFSQDKYGIDLKFRWRKDLLARIAVTALEKSEGLAAAAKYLEGFDDRGQTRMLTALAISKSEDLVGLAKLLHDRPNSDENRRIRTLFWARWDEVARSPFRDEEKPAAEEILAELSPENRLEARLAMVTQGKSLPPTEGLSSQEALKLTAEAYLAAPFFRGESDEALSDWLGENASGLDLDEAIRARLKRWDGRAWSYTEANPGAGKISLALNLSDNQEGREIARKSFQALLKSSPNQVRYFLNQAKIPDDLRAEFENLHRTQK